MLAPAGSPRAALDLVIEGFEDESGEPHPEPTDLRPPGGPCCTER